MARRDPEALLEQKRAECAEQQRELVGLRRELATMAQRAVLAEDRGAEGDRLVRWLLRDQSIPTLRLEVTPGSALDLSMMGRLVEVMAQVDDQAATWANYDGVALQADREGIPYGTVPVKNERGETIGYAAQPDTDGKTVGEARFDDLDA